MLAQHKCVVLPSGTTWTRLAVWLCLRTNQIAAAGKRQAEAENKGSVVSHRYLPPEKRGISFAAAVRSGQESCLVLWRPRRRTLQFGTCQGLPTTRPRCVLCIQIRIPFFPQKEEPP